MFDISNVCQTRVTKYSAISSLKLSLYKCNVCTKFYGNYITNALKFAGNIKSIFIMNLVINIWWISDIMNVIIESHVYKELRLFRLWWYYQIMRLHEFDIIIR